MHGDGFSVNLFRHSTARLEGVDPDSRECNRFFENAFVGARRAVFAVIHRATEPSTGLLAVLSPGMMLLVTDSTSHSRPLRSTRMRQT